MIIKVDADYLKDEKTAYPIRIDPSIEINYSNNGTGAIQDVTINSNGGSNGTSGSLYIGKRNDYGKSRVLMRFPGLDLSSIRSYHLITYATVELRDVRCTQEQMSVLCYIFNGSGWIEGAATWGSVSASSYTAGQTTKQVSYAIGAELNPAHRYAFQITGAVQGWKNGTYTQDKGLLFKATDSVENGSTELYKTFASYNMSAYQPSITVQYATTPALSTITTVPYSTSKTMTANYAYSFKFTPTESGQYSLWTTGNLSTMVYVFNSAAMANPTASNRGSGHGNNCCITVNLNEGVNYYFVIQGTSRTTAGNFVLKFYRGLPMSGSEKPSYETEFNNDQGGYSHAPLYDANCYAYALASWVNPKSGSQYGVDITPGAIATDNAMENFPDYMSDEQIAVQVLNLIRDDYESMGLSRSDVMVVQETSMPPEGYYKIALYKSNTGGFHFLRQVSDKNGAWAHKPRRMLVSFVDDTPKAIYTPRTANFNEWTTFICYYAIKPCT